MMPNALNLLEPEKKTRLQKLIYHIFIKDILEMTLIVCAVLASALLWSYLLMIDRFSDLAQSSTLINRAYSSYNQEVKKTNQAIQQVNLASEGYTDLMPRFLELAQNLPENIRFTSLEIDRRANTVILAGVAKTRDALINYENDLKNFSWLNKPVAPFSQLLQKENVSFQFKAGLKNLPPPPP